jgi:hypothetical protein
MIASYEFHNVLNLNQAAVDSLAQEKEARLNFERSQASLSEELAKAQRELLSSKQKVKLKLKFKLADFVQCRSSF